MPGILSYFSFKPDSYHTPESGLAQCHALLLPTFLERRLGCYLARGGRPSIRAKVLRWVGTTPHPQCSFFVPSRKFPLAIPGTRGATALAYSSQSARTTPPALRAACPTPAGSGSLPLPPAPSTHRRGRTVPGSGCPPPKAESCPASRPAPSEPPAVPTHCKISPLPRTRTRTHAASLPLEASSAAPAARLRQCKSDPPRCPPPAHAVPKNSRKPHALASRHRR